MRAELKLLRVYGVLISSVSFKTHLRYLHSTLEAEYLIQCNTEVHSKVQMLENTNKFRQTENAQALEVNMYNKSSEINQRAEESRLQTN